MEDDSLSRNLTENEPGFENGICIWGAETGKVERKDFPDEAQPLLVCMHVWKDLSVFLLFLYFLF